MSRHQHLAACLVFCCLPCFGADLDEIVRRGTATLKSDWAADPDYAYMEKDEVLKNGMMTSKTSRVVYIEGSDYYLPIAIDDQPLPPEREKTELEKLKREAARRKNESPEARRQRIQKYQKQCDENEALVLDFPSAFNFELLPEESIDGYQAYVLSGMPKKRTGPPQSRRQSALRHARYGLARQRRLPRRPRGVRCCHSSPNLRYSGEGPAGNSH